MPPPRCLRRWPRSPRPDCGSPAVLPLWPRIGRAAKLLLLRGVKGGRGDAVVLPGLVLHDADGRYMPQAEAILREGAALGFAAP